MTWAAGAPEWLALAAAFGALLYARRFGGGTALGELERANRVLERRVHELEGDNRRLTGEVAVLQAQTNVALAIAPVLSALTEHEAAAGKRATAMLSVLDLIADRLGPDAVAA